MAQLDVHTGGCFCGATRFVFTGLSQGAVICYCVSCRKAVGATRVAWLTVRTQDLRFTGNAPKVLLSSPGIRRSFCEHCGTSLTWQEEKSQETIDVTIASFDHPEHFPPSDEVWIGHRLAWDTGAGGLRQNSGDV